MESVSCCYQDNNPAMADECGMELSDAGSWGSLHKQAQQQTGAGGEQEGGQ